ncbi:hypothetical protein KPH14_010050 [Odynerus spinipes]|uniref:Uncharacterized protein n=1 Tax=Odynerus spinipes TaxID=1348599 RepID=A0AAD9RT18_9HYME|nr:hypothetical protein KPH14_010050 [Odynerus spinipes]
MATFEAQFTAYAKYTNPKSDGMRISLTQSNKWMRQAKIFNDKVTQEDAALAFNNLHRELLTIEDYKKFIDDFAQAKRLNPAVIKEKMAKCGPPVEDRTRIESVVLKNVEDPSGYV